MSAHQKWNVMLKISGISNRLMCEFLKHGNLLASSECERLNSVECD